MPELVRDGVQAGASGFVLKDVSAEELCAAVRGVARGQVVLQGQGVAHLLAGLTTAAPLPVTTPAVAARDLGLTDRECDVLGAIARGLSNADIAAELYEGEATVKTHINHLFAKLGARDRVHALLLARQRGLV